MNEAPPHRTFARQLAGWVFRAGKAIVLALLVIWATLAIYYSNLPWASARLGVAVAFALFFVWR